MKGIWHPGKKRRVVGSMKKRKVGKEVSGTLHVKGSNRVLHVELEVQPCVCVVGG